MQAAKILASAECIKRADQALIAARQSMDRDLATHLRAMAKQWEYLAGVQARLAEMQNFLDNHGPSLGKRCA